MSPLAETGDVARLVQMVRIARRTGFAGHADTLEHRTIRAHLDRLVALGAVLAGRGIGHPDVAGCVDKQTVRKYEEISADRLDRLPVLCRAGKPGLNANSRSCWCHSGRSPRPRRADPPRRRRSAPKARLTPLTWRNYIEGRRTEPEGPAPSWERLRQEPRGGRAGAAACTSRRRSGSVLCKNGSTSQRNECG